MTPGYISILLHASIFSNNTLESCNFWVNSRVISFCATGSPGHNTDKLLAKNQRAARITLEGVFTSARHSSNISCSQWFHRKRHKHYCILHGMWCILRLLGALPEGASHHAWVFCSHWLQQENQQEVLRRSAKLVELLDRRWMERIREMKHWNHWGVLLEGRVFFSPRMICAVIKHSIFCTQPPTVCVPCNVLVPVIVPNCITYN